MLVSRSENSLKLLESILKAGNVAAIACDTIYGFVGIVPDTESAIRQIKGRGETKPFLRLIAGLEGFSDEVLVPEWVTLEDFWPGPFTLILPLTSGGSAGFRLPEDERLRNLIEAVGAPLFSTSVNRAGEQPLNDPGEIHREFGNEVALVEDSGTYHGKAPSTVVNLTVRPAVIIRQGAGILPPEYL